MKMQNGGTYFPRDEIIMNKPTLVLIPGLLCDEAVWQYQIPALEKFANIIIPKLGQYNRAALMIEHILESCPKEFFLAGHSMGGWLAIEMMRKNSKRVKKLCVLATSSVLDRAAKKKLRQKCISSFSSANVAEMAEQFAMLYIYQPGIKKQLLDMFTRNMADLVSQQKAMLKRVSCEDILPTINVPTTVIVGENDDEFYQPTTHVAENIKGAELLILKNCGHMLMLEQPAACTDAMLFWMKN